MAIDSLLGGKGEDLRGESGVGGGGGEGFGDEFVFDMEICSNSNNNNLNVDREKQQAAIEGASVTSNFSTMSAVSDTSDESECSVGESECSACSSAVGSPHVIPQWMPSPKPGMVFQTIRKDKRIVLEEIRAVRPTSLQPFRFNGRLVLREYKQSQHAPMWQACHTYDAYASCSAKDRWKSDAAGGHTRRRWSVDESRLAETRLDENLPSFTPSDKPPLPRQTREPSICDHPTSMTGRPGSDGSNSWELSREGGGENRHVSYESRISQPSPLVRSRSLPIACHGIPVPVLHASRFTEKPELAADMISLLVEAKGMHRERGSEKD